MQINVPKTVSDKSKMNVTDVTTRPTLEHFVTLVTDLKKVDKTLFPIEMSHLSRLSHMEKSTLLCNAVKTPKINYKPALEWITIALEEGHIEPSQPCVGRVVGWPKRRLKIKSLLIEFTFWCRKQRTDIDVFDQKALLELLDIILIRICEEYEFPPLESCRQKFNELRNL